MNFKFFQEPLLTDSVTVFGILAVALGFVFYTSGLDSWRKFYKIFPALFLCYFIPAMLNTTNIIDSENEAYKGIYDVAKYFFLPASLILLTLGIDLKALFNLGWKPLAMFLTGTLGIIIGGPIALLLAGTLFPDLLVVNETNGELWRGLSTVAGSWIGGGANQTAMLEIYEYNKDLFAQMLLVDIVVANIWMAILLVGIEKRDSINRWLKADNSSVITLQKKVEAYEGSIRKYPTLRAYILILAVAFGGVALAYLGSNFMSEWLKQYAIFSDKDSYFSSFSSTFLWLILIVTLVGVGLSSTKARNLEGFGASKIGSVFIYLLVAAIGVHMDIAKIFENPGVIVLGLIWMAIHVMVLIGVAKLIKAPYFFIAVGSKANIGGAASAPVVAAAFHPSLAPVGALLAIFGYIIGSLGAVLCTILMQMAST